MSPFKLTSREYKQDDTIIQVGNRLIGGKEVHLFAGPCAVESRSQLMEIAFAVKEGGATFLRGEHINPALHLIPFEGLQKKGWSC